MNHAIPDIEAAPPQVERSVVPARTGWDWFVRGWRPFCGWVCGLILATRGVAVPVTQLIQGKPIDHMDLVALTALLGVLGLGHWRSKERIAGVTG